MNSEPEIAVNGFGDVLGEIWSCCACCDDDCHGCHSSPCENGCNDSRESADIT